MIRKRHVKQALVHGGRWIARGSTTNRVVVLCYHSVHPAIPFASVSPSVFERHLRWLKAHCNVVTFGNLPLDTTRSGAARTLTSRGTAADRPLEKGSSSGARPLETPSFGGARPTVAITFDDGYLDNYTEAFPLLVKHDLKATFFVTAGFIDRDDAVLRRFSRDRKLPAADIEAASWSQLREMRAAGMEIEDHTYHHPNLSRLTLAEAVDEFARSRTTIEERLGAPVSATAYPYGKIRRHFTEDTVAAVKAVGFERAAAVTFRGVRPGDFPWAVPRFFVSRDDENTLRDKIFGAWDVIGKLQETVPSTLARLVSPIDFAY